MRISGLCLLALLAATPALAQDGLAAVQKLETTIRDADATWQDKWDAYAAAKKAIAGDEAAEAAYVAIRPDVARALQRDNLPASGWLMGLFGATLLWGGFLFCVGVAKRSGTGIGAED